MRLFNLQSRIRYTTLSHSSHVMLSMSSVLSSVHVLDSILDERNVNYMYAYQNMWLT